jgi:hypothetical protein
MTRLASICALCALCGSALAESVEVAWSPSTSTNVAGYRVSYQLSAVGYQPTTVLDVGAATNVVITNLIVGETYQFYATAYTSNGIESLPSNTVTYSVRPQPPTLIEDYVLLTWGGPWEILESTNLLSGFSVIATTPLPWFVTRRDRSGNRFYRVRSAPPVLKLQFSPAP